MQPELQYVWDPEKLIERDTHVRHGIHGLQMTPLCLSDNALAESYSYAYALASVICPSGSSKHIFIEVLSLPK